MNNIQVKSYTLAEAIQVRHIVRGNVSMDQAMDNITTMVPLYPQRTVIKSRMYDAILDQVEVLR